MLLLPEAVDVFGSDNPGAFHHAFVDGLDLQATVFARVAAKTTGRPGYAPSDLLKLYIYGYLNRVRSSRRLEAEARRKIEIWLLRHLRPDFNNRHRVLADIVENRCYRFRAFPPRCLALDPLTLISARRTLRCRRNGLSRCFAVMSQFESLLPTPLRKFGSEFSRRRGALEFYISTLYCGLLNPILDVWLNDSENVRIAFAPPA
jgi:hypothetical protein